MGSVLHPVGDRPAGTYWWRRILVLAVAVVLIGGLFWVFRPVGGTQASPPVTPAPQVTPPAPAGSGTPLVTTPSTPKPTPTPTGPVICSKENTDLSLAGYQKVAQGGKQTFKVVLTNKGPTQCELKLTDKNFTLEVSSGKDRIWTTDHCTKWVPAEKATIKPGKTHEFTVIWPLKRSAANCKTTKDVIKPGTYVGKAAFDTAATGRQVFLVTRKV